MYHRKSYQFEISKIMQRIYSIQILLLNWFIIISPVGCRIFYTWCRGWRIVNYVYKSVSEDWNNFIWNNFTFILWTLSLCRSRLLTDSTSCCRWCWCSISIRVCSGLHCFGSDYLRSNCPWSDLGSMYVHYVWVGFSQVYVRLGPTFWIHQDIYK